MTVWAVRRERYGDLLIHPAGNRSGGPLPVCRARLASRRLRVTFGFPLGKRCGASLVSSQRLFQLLPQALVLRQCALQLLLQGLDSPFEFLLPIRGANAIGGLHPFHDDTNAEICSELSLKVLYLLSYPLVNILGGVRESAGGRKAALNLGGGTRRSSTGRVAAGLGWRAPEAHIAGSGWKACERWPCGPGKRSRPHTAEVGYPLESEFAVTEVAINDNHRRTTSRGWCEYGPQPRL